MARPSRKGEDRSPDERACTAYRDTILRLVDLPTPSDHDIFTLSEDAHVERETVEATAWNVRTLPDTSSAFRAHLSKWPGMFARLVLTFHLIESPEVHPVISGETARKVARFMIDYLLPNAARFYADVLGHEHMRHSRWIAGHILTHRKARITAREIGRAYHELYQDRAALFSAMEALTLARGTVGIPTAPCPQVAPVMRLRRLRPVPDPPRDRADGAERGVQAHGSQSSATDSADRAS